MTQSKHTDTGLALCNQNQWPLAGGYANHSFFGVNSNLLSDRYMDNYYMDTNRTPYAEI